MWRFVSAARMAQIKADARAEGYIKAVREGLAANDAAKEDRIVTSENTHAVNTSVKEVQAVHDMHKRVDAAQKQSEVRLSSHKSVISGLRKRKAPTGFAISSYSDKSIVLIEDGKVLESFIADRIGLMTVTKIAIEVKKKLGTHAKGILHPIKISQAMISKIICRTLIWDDRKKHFYRNHNR